MVGDGASPETVIETVESVRRWVARNGRARRDGVFWVRNALLRAAIQPGDEEAETKERDDE